MKQSRAFKAELHKVKVRIADKQSGIVERRAILLKKLLPLVMHPDDKKLIESALSGKNLTPRYW